MELDRLVVTLKAEDRAALTRLAGAWGVSLAAAVRRAVREAVGGLGAPAAAGGLVVGVDPGPGVEVGIGLVVEDE